SSAPMPNIERVRAVKAPSAPPTAIGNAVRQPGPNAKETTSRIVRPGMTRRIVEAAAKADQSSKDISSLLERKEKDKSWGRRDCKEVLEKIFGAGLPGSSGEVTGC